MKKVLICCLIASSFGFVTSVRAQAAQDFKVQAAVLGKCMTDTTGTPVINFGDIDAFGTAAIPDKTASIVFKCTRNLAILSATLSAETGTVAGLAYSLVLSGPDTVAGAAASGGTGAGADRHTYTVTGSMASGQAGDSTALTEQTRTLTITF